MPKLIKPKYVVSMTCGYVESQFLSTLIFIQHHSENYPARKFAETEQEALESLAKRLLISYFDYKYEGHRIIEYNCSKLLAKLYDKNWFDLNLKPRIKSGKKKPFDFDVEDFKLWLCCLHGQTCDGSGYVSYNEDGFDPYNWSLTSDLQEMFDKQLIPVVICEKAEDVIGKLVLKMFPMLKGK